MVLCDLALKGMGKSVYLQQQPLVHRPHVRTQIGKSIVPAQARRVPLRRVGELGRLRGARFGVSLLLELCDLAAPALRALWRKASGEQLQHTLCAQRPYASNSALSSRVFAWVGNWPKLPLTTAPSCSHCLPACSLCVLAPGAADWAELGAHLPGHQDEPQL